MPSIMVVAHTDGDTETTFQLNERVSALTLNDPHFSAQLIERVAWAVADAEQAERMSAEGSDRG